MTKHLLVILLLLFVKSGWTQNTNLDYKNAVKIYNLTTFEKNIKVFGDTSSFIRSTINTLQILHPTIAFQWKTKNNNFHEIELTNLMLNKVGSSSEVINDTIGNVQIAGSGADITTTLISVRYEYLLKFNKSKDTKLVPSLGFGFSPYFYRNNFNPRTSFYYPVSETIFSVRTFITPRLTYFISSKVFIDLNIPISFFEANFLIDKAEDPLLPEKQRTTTTYSYENFPKVFYGRIGVGLKL